MKKLISLLLALCLLTGLAAAEALPAEAPAAVGLPAIGDTVYGFEAKEIREFPLIGAQVVLFEHQRTGAKLMYIANEDTNRVFDLTFMTRPTDDTGLPHVFEHSTLDGSAKYPSKALFFNLSYQTYNTFMNAMTYSTMTTYPVASLSEAQLLKYADYYTDSCLNPTIMEDESIYREEAWRYRMASMDDPLTIEGTVYSEMLGATTLERRALINGYQAAFPGSVVGLDQGGNPDAIPDMTWDSLKNYHNLFYHPSNLIAFLYGQFDDYTAFLSLLDEAFSPFEKVDLSFVDSGYTPITGPVTVSVGFPTEAGSSVEHKSLIEYLVVCPGLKGSGQEEMVVNTLTDLLVADSSVLSQAIRRALPTARFSCYIDTTAPDDAIVFYVANVNQEDAELFRSIVDTTLQSIVENGFGADTLDAITASLNLSTHLVGESDELGIDIIPNIAYSYSTSGDPFEYMEYVDALDSLKAWNDQGLYTAAIQKWLIGSQLTALVTTYPEPGQKEARDAALAEKLAAIKAGMTEEELQAIIDQTNAEKPEEDTSGMIADLTAVTVASLPEEVKLYDVQDATGEDTIRRISATAGVENIGRTAIFLNASDLKQEDLHWFKLYTQLVGLMDTTKHTKEELDVLSERYLYNGEVRVSLLGDKDDFTPYLRLGWTGTGDDAEEAFDLIYELAFETDFTDVERLKEQVSAAKAALRSGITGSPYNIQLYRALAVNSELYRYFNYTNYLDFYAFLEKTEAALDSEPETVIAALQAVQAQLKNRDHAIYAFAGDADSLAVNQPLAEQFFGKLNAEPITAVAYDLPVPAKREALIVDAQVQFNLIVADYASLGLDEYDGSLDAISSLMSDMYLVPLLRDQYGVYGPQTGAITDGGVYLLAYRDPNVRETFTVFESLADLLRQADVTQETLNGYIMSSYAYYAKSSGELTGAMNAILNILTNDPQDKNLEYMRELKAVTPEAVKAAADMYQKLCENGVRTTSGSAAAINANADLYDVILNPFNVQDTSKITLSDVPEDHPYYAAVRFVFESGLMSADGDAFNPDGDATAADLYAALYALIGGPAGAAEEGMEYLAQYGLVPDGFTPDTVVTHGQCDQVLVALGALIGLPLEADEPNETTDLPISRAELAEQIQLFAPYLQ